MTRERSTPDAPAPFVCPAHGEQPHTPAWRCLNELCRAYVLDADRCPACGIVPIEKEPACPLCTRALLDLFPAPEADSAEATPTKAPPKGGAN